MPDAASPPAPTAPPALILDTNAVLDWFVFEHPALRTIAACLTAGHGQWIATHPMRDELAHVLGRGQPPCSAAQAERVWAHWSRLVLVLPEPQPALAGRLWCRDPDDQKFIDLAVAAPARWLVTRDRALLKLARRAAQHGVEVTTPELWRGPASGCA